MIVIDASAAVELVLGTRAGQQVDRIIAAGAPAACPAHFDAECWSALTRAARRGVLGAGPLPELARAVAQFAATRYPLAPLLLSAPGWVGRVSATDAFYVALAAVLDAPLLTCDARLQRGARRDIEVVLVAPSGS